MAYKSIAVIGGFPLARANLGHNMAYYLSKIGHNANLIIRDSQLHEWKSLHPNMEAVECEILRVIPSKKFDSRIILQLREVSLLRQYDLIISIGLGGMWYLPFIGKPYVSYATGADLTELAGGIGYGGYQVKQARRVFRNARLVFYSVESSHVKMIKRLGLKNVVPWRQFVDPEFWKAPIQKRSPSKDSALKIFHPTSLQWISKFTGQRLKSNDLLFKGFRMYLDQNGKGILYYRKRGPDISQTEDLVKQLELLQHVEALPESANPIEAKQTMLDMDVIVDQFNVGNFGLITLEAMSLGKPVIAFFPSESSKLAYPPPDEPPPVLNASTPEGIAEQLHRMQDVEESYRQSISSRLWIEKYHDPFRLAEWYWNLIDKVC